MEGEGVGDHAVHAREFPPFEPCTTSPGFGLESLGLRVWGSSWTPPPAFDWRYPAEQLSWPQPKTDAGVNVEARRGCRVLFQHFVCAYP